MADLEIKKIGVVGCGQMGSGIAEAALRSGFSVLVSEIDAAILQKGLNGIEKSLARDVGRGKLSEADKNKLIQNLNGTTSLEDFANCDLVIEAAPEKLEIKKHIFSELDMFCQPHTILASNTSCLPITDMANVTNRKDKVLGMHFFNPVSLMRLVELVKTEFTSPETIEISKQFVEKLGKVSVVSPDIPGFIVNRILTPFLLEAIKLLETGEVSKEELDKAIRLGLNHPMGPLALGDYIGLDICLSICEAMYNQLKDERFKPPEILKSMVAQGKLGRKSGKGFYDYNIT